MNKQPITNKRINQLIKDSVVAEVKERNEYRALLEECLFCLNQLRNKKIDNSEGMTTYKLISKIELSFKTFDSYAIPTKN